MKYIRLISGFLGLSMFMFGFLKFFHPFKGWYAVQISASELGGFSYSMGILGELAVGLTLILAVLWKDKISFSLFGYALAGASLVIVVMMATGIYVHLHPSVPAEVLPMKIKPPYIPGFFLFLGVLNKGLVIRHLRNRVLAGKHERKF